MWKAGFIYTRMEAIGTSCYLADCLVMAITYRSSHVAITTALPPEEYIARLQQRFSLDEDSYLSSSGCHLTHVAAVLARFQSVV